MTSTSAVSTRSLPLTTPRLAEPPPAMLELSDGDTVVGWTRGATIGFHGFADEMEASHAAWMAYRTMARRLARTDGRTPPPVDIAPLALARRGGSVEILADGRAIATLAHPGEGRGSGAGSFGFEVPSPADALRVQSTARLIYRTLRRSGLRWAQFARPRRGLEDAVRHSKPTIPTSGPDAPTSGRAAAAPQPPRQPRDLAGAGLAALSALALVPLIAAWLGAISAPLVVATLGAAAAACALVVGGALLRLVLTDVRVARGPHRSWRAGPRSVRPGFGRTAWYPNGMAPARVHVGRAR